ncbi:MAG: chromate transporter [Clostridia bacterium]|nr:chromate transporter [Clostridia bacterium]
MKELLQLFWAFFKIGSLTFGGGYAMLPMLERELADRYKWVTLEEIVDYFAIGQCTPGVIAVNTATFVGHKKRGVIGGIVATLGVITPSLIIITAIASVLELVMGNAVVQHAFSGISVAVCALMVQSVIKMGKSGIKNIFGIVVALASFCASMFLKVSPIIIVLCAGVCGAVYKAVKGEK